MPGGFGEHLGQEDRFGEGPFVKEVIEFSLEDGNAIPVEVDRADYDWNRISSRGGRVHQKDDIPRSFHDALERIRPMADQLVERLRNMAAEPESIEVEFGIKLSGEVGALIASTSTEANFTVKLAWSHKPGTQPEAVAGDPPESDTSAS
jgi:hypothetical protein